MLVQLTTISRNKIELFCKLFAQRCRNSSGLGEEEINMKRETRRSLCGSSLRHFFPPGSVYRRHVDRPFHRRNYGETAVATWQRTTVPNIKVLPSLAANFECETSNERVGAFCRVSMTGANHELTLRLANLCSRIPVPLECHCGRLLPRWKTSSRLYRDFPGVRYFSVVSFPNIELSIYKSISQSPLFLWK